MGILSTGTEDFRVTDQSQNEPDSTEPVSEEDEAEEFELEGVMAREQGANALRRLADGVESGSVELGRDEGAVTVPEEFEVEVEYEEEAQEAELEVELEWSLDGGEAVAPEDDGSNGTEEADANEAEADDQE